MSFSDYLENKILNHVFGIEAYAQPDALYVALSTSNPLDDGSGVSEPSGNNYARINHNDWATATSGSTSNVGVVTFPTASGTWGTVTYVCIFDALTGGNLIASGALTASRAVTVGDTIRFASRDIRVSLS